jgi:putative acetyltransferase
MLATLEERAAREGLETLALETGILFLAARRVYERAGFAQTGPFADYPDSGYAAFYAKTIRPAAAGGSLPV